MSTHFAAVSLQNMLCFVVYSAWRMEEPFKVIRFTAKVEKFHEQIRARMYNFEENVKV